MAQPMGLGNLGNSTLVYKRKFRWTLKINNVCGNKNIPEYYVKTAARPQLDTEELEINFLNAKSWIPGKSSWQTMTVTYYDVATQDNTALWDWICTIYEFNGANLRQASQKKDYAAEAVLTLFDGPGNALEEWTLKDVWPQAVNWGDLDMAANDEVNIELTLRFSQVGFVMLCPGHTPAGCFTACTK